MAFRDFNGAGGKLPESAERNSAPAMVPLSLELVPPSLCHSFGVALNDAQALQQSALGLGMGAPAGGGLAAEMDFRFRAQDAYAGQCLGAAQQMHAFPMGMLNPFGQLPPLGGLESQAYANRMLQLANSGALHAPPSLQQQPGRVGQLPPSSAAYFGDAGGRRAAPEQQQQHGAPQRLDAGLPLDAGYGRATFLSPQDVEGRLRQAGYGDVGRGVKRPMDGAPGSGADAQAGQHPSMEPVKRSRLVWTRELHQRFEEAVDKAGGIDVAVPKSVLEHMSIPGLTRDNVASHLQKHRMHRKRDKELGAATATASACLSKDPALTVSETFGNAAGQRSSTELQDVSAGGHTSVARAAPDRMQGGGGEMAKGPVATATVSTTHMTSDSGSRRTAFAALRSTGQHSTPDSRDTAVAGGGCGEGAPGTMASSIRHGGGADALLTVAAAAAAARGEDDTETGVGGSGSGSASEAGGVKGAPEGKADATAHAAGARPTLADCHS